MQNDYSLLSGAESRVTLIFQSPGNWYFGTGTITWYFGGIQTLANQGAKN